MNVKKLLTEFQFGGDHVIYTARDYQYGNATIATMKKSEGAVTVAVGDGRFVSLTDADRADFSVLSWERKKDSPEHARGCDALAGVGRAAVQDLVAGDGHRRHARASSSRTAT